MNDEASYLQAVREHAAVLRRFATTLVAAAEVDDLLQDALTRAWLKWHTFDPVRGSARSWFLAVLADQAKARWRKRRLEISTDLVPDRAIRDFGATARVDLRSAIADLPSRQRTAIVLRHYVDLSTQQIAEVMNCSQGTVTSTLFHAYKTLSGRLGADYVRS